MAIAEKMKRIMSRPSAIRDVFDYGLKLKAQYGPENVFDFSLGDPDLPPPSQVRSVLAELVADPTVGHGYMPNAGHRTVRQAVAAQVARIMDVDVGPDQVVMTVGAAGGLNCVFKALLDEGDEVVVPAPYFVGYGAYVSNYGGALRPVPTGNGFQLDLTAIERALADRTKAVLINSPNNPTGAIYPAEALAGLADLLNRAWRRTGRRIYLVSDEPYRAIVYDGQTVPSVLKAYDHTIVVTSYSKELSLPGERIGFVAVHPAAEDADQVVQAVVTANRMLGFVNAPSLAQLLVGRLQGITVDVDVYRRRRDALCDGLARIGYRFTRPSGAFYLFPEAPGGDDLAFTERLKQEKILAVPGTGFGCPGYFRLSYAVPDRTIARSMPGFERAFQPA